MKGFPLRLFILFFCAAGTLLILQSAFDASDHRKAEHAVRAYSINGSRTLGEFVEARAPGGAWSTEITHSCRGVVRATYAAPGGTWRFDYDVPAHAIHPADDAGRQALEAFAVAAPKTAPSTDGGAANAPAPNTPAPNAPTTNAPAPSAPTTNAPTPNAPAVNSAAPNPPTK